MCNSLDLKSATFVIDKLCSEAVAAATATVAADLSWSCTGILFTLYTHPPPTLTLDLSFSAPCGQISACEDIFISYKYILGVESRL